MKTLRLLAGFLVLVSGHLHADHHRGYADVDGEVYVKVDNYIHKLKAEMRVPEGGEGPIYLELKDRRHGKEVKVESLRYFYTEEKGRTLVYIIFPFKTEDEVAVMRGTYMRGSNRITYFGDVFIAPKQTEEDLTAENANELLGENCRHHASFFFEDRFHGRDHD